MIQADFTTFPVIQPINDSYPATINHYGPAKERFIYELGTFITNNDVQGIQKLIEQMNTLRKSNGNNRLDTRTSDYICYIHEQIRKEKNEQALRLIAPFLLERGRSFIFALGSYKHDYEEYYEEHKEKNEAKYQSLMKEYYCDMIQSQWDMDTILKDEKIIIKDIMLLKKYHLIETFSFLPLDIQNKILQKVEANNTETSSDNDFQEKIIAIKNIYQHCKEQEEAKKVANPIQKSAQEITPTSAI